MLEIPESYVLSKQLKDIVLNKRIKNVICAHSPHKFAWFTGNPEDYPKLIIGKKITDVINLSGRVEIHIEEMRLLLNDGVNIRYLDCELSQPKKHQLLIEFEDDSKLVFTVQMYGGMFLYKEGENDDFYYLVSKQKPSVLSKEFNEKYFKEIYKNEDKKISVKALLAAKQRIPGLGNGCLQDILFNAKINPQTKLKYLSQDDFKKLYLSLKNTIKDMCVGGGRDTEKDLFGNEGGYKTVLSNKTFHKPCLNCNGEITRKAYMGGKVYFCPVCQPVKK